MTKEQVAIVGLVITVLSLVMGLFASSFKFGTEIGMLTTKVEAQTEEIKLLKEEIRGINGHLIQWVGRHETRLSGGTQ